MGQNKLAIVRMMWQTITQKYRTEPIELLMLKQRLAKVSCNCYRHYSSGSYHPSYDTLHTQKRTKDSETQAERFIPIGEIPAIPEKYIKDVLCPTCNMTLNILRGGAVRVLKDQVTETTTSMFCSDKCIGRKESTWELPGILSPNRRKRLHPERVTFRDIPCQPYVEVKGKPLIGQSCVCLEDFIDSIRPPLH